MKIVFLLLMLVYCTITDIGERKIHNRALLIGLAMALTLNFMDMGVLGIYFTLAGLITGILLFIIPYILGWMGAGDVKLIGVIGAFTGWKFIMYNALAIAVVGGIISILLLTKDRKKAWAFRNMILFFFTRSSAYLREESLNYSFPYAVAILIGTCITLGLEMMGYV